MPTLLIENANVYTLNPAQPRAEAVACRRGRIIAVGTNEAIRARSQPDTRRVDAGGRLVLPGLIDSHVHFVQYAIRRREVNLFGLQDFAAVRHRLREAAVHTPPGEWIVGWGWEESQWDITPHRALLDEVAPAHPVLLRRVDMHTGWVNSRALALAHITRHTADPPESRIEREADGTPTGLLREWQALNLIETLLPRPDSAALRQWTAEAMHEAHRFGLTGIHDQRIQNEGRQSWRIFQDLRRADRLHLRVHLNLAAEFLPEAAALGLQAGFGDDNLWLGHVKAFADGTLGSRTALMLQPFSDQPGNRGLTIMPPDQLGDLAQRARRAGFSLSVHAIGDLAVRQVLNVFANHPPDLAAGRLPHRLEHVQIIHPDDVPRLARHQVVASMQPVHLAIDWQAADTAWGERTPSVYAFRSLLKHDTQLAFGSDAPVVPLNPLLGLQAAVARQDFAGQPAGGWHPAQRLTLPEALHGYTVGPATLSGQQHQQGRIAPGCWADMILLAPNLFNLPPPTLPPPGWR